MSGKSPPTHVTNSAVKGGLKSVKNHFNALPTAGFAIEIDGRVKSEFATIDGAVSGARELKARFPQLQIRIYDALNKDRLDVTTT